ncbi:ABC transporter permease [Granulicella sp. WH15]|uniref:ABC transporter permease n=1 Tax=Granulicella sp. WH15 TaxID=2602070 RepID=UPI001366FC28|nr:ABC transporter permease [Granulicella sp. WH15]QHN03021.1 ABC transporter permease [Granulicella sp. WH15]
MSTPNQPRFASLVLLLLKLRAVLVLFALLVAFSILTPSFLTTNNLSILAKHVAISAILAVGMTFVVLAGGIDLSVGSIAGLSGMVAGGLLTVGIAGHVTGAVPAAIIALIVSCLVGLLNGVLVSRLGVAPFIATLGTMYIARGTALLLSQGKTFPNLAGTAERGSTGFSVIGQSFFLGVPLPVWLMIVITALAAAVATRTPFGRHVYAVGGNERAARLAGIRVERVKLLTYCFSAVCAGLVGLVIASQLESAHPATGESFELNAIAAVVLGGTSLMGGRGSIGGSLIGAFVIGVLADGLVMLGVSEFWQIVIKGVVIVLAVTVDQLQTKVQSRMTPVTPRAERSTVAA